MIVEVYAMNRKNTWMLMPTVFLPYYLLFTTFVLLYSTEVTFFKWLLRSLGDNGWAPVLFLVIYSVIALALNIFYVYQSIRKGMEPLFLAKVAMIIKLVQIPAFLIIFVYGVLFTVAIFTIGFAIAFVIFDALSLLLSGMVMMASVVNSKRRREVSNTHAILFILSQFMFCVDVVMSIVWYRRLKK